MPLFSRQPLAAAAAAAVAVLCVSDSALPPLLHFLTNFHNGLRRHLAFSISLSAATPSGAPFFFFGSIFSGKQKNLQRLEFVFFLGVFFGVVVCVFSFCL
jgi:hypothetical protein